MINKHTKNCHIIDVAVSGDARVMTKQEEKIDKYQDLAREKFAHYGKLRPRLY